MDKEKFLKKVVHHYVSSFNFNGFSVENLTDELKDVIIDLVRDGRLEIIAGSDGNPYVKNFPIKKKIEQQVNSLLEEKFVVLYPTRKTMMHYVKKQPEGFFHR